MLVAALAAGAFVVLGGDDGGGYAFGTVGDIIGDAVVRTGDDGEARTLEEGETVLAGWVVETDRATVTLDLPDGGVVRFDSGATLSFVDVSRRGGDDEPAPAIEIDGGRTWFNPVNEPDSTAVALDIPQATVATTGNPVGVDCTGTCAVEAPAGGVTLTTDGDIEAAPGLNEIVVIDSADALQVRTGDGPSAWAAQNTTADSEDGLPEPEAVENNTGVKGTAIADGTYNLTLVVTGDPTGDAIPDDLKFFPQQTFTVDLVADGSSCVTVPCDVNVTANDGATGTARIENGSVVVSFTQPINCFDETFTTVVVPDIGTTAVQATLQITEIVQDGDRWVATALDGEGTVAANLTAPCNAGETLGTATSVMTLGGARAP